jgi:hypothetical protein
MLPETEKFITAWHAAIAARDINLLDGHIAEDAVFRSPAFWNPKSGKPVLLAVLWAAFDLLEDFTYTKEWVDGHEVLMEFDAKVGGKSVKGIDRFWLDDQGRITEMEVLVRPLNGLAALAQGMGRKLGLDTGQGVG